MQWERTRLEIKQNKPLLPVGDASIGDEQLIAELCPHVGQIGKRKVQCCP